MIVTWIVALGAAFVALRTVYVFLYVGDKPSARSAVWSLAFLATCGLLLLPLVA